MPSVDKDQEQEAKKDQETSSYRPPKDLFISTQVWDNIPPELVETYGEKLTQIRKDSGIMVDHRTSPVCHFYMYLLATRPDYTVDDILHFGERHADEATALMGEFLDEYGKLTAQQNADPPRLNAVESAGYVGSIIKKGMEKLLKCRITDVDINSVSDLDKPEFRIAVDLIANMYINTSQDYMCYTADSVDPAVRETFMSANGGRDTFERRDDRLGCFARNIPNLVTVASNPGENVQKRADSLYLLRSLWPDFRGKVLEETELPVSAVGLPLNSLALELHKDSVNDASMDQAAREYLDGSTGELLWKEELDRQLAIRRVMEAEQINFLYSSTITRLGSMDFEIYNEGLDMTALSAIDDKSALSPGDSAAVVALWDKTFGSALYKTDSTYMILSQGLTPLDMIMIDGKSASETYGAKYASLSPEKREQAIHAEILAACADPEVAVEIRGARFGNDFNRASVTDERVRVSFRPQEVTFSIGAAPGDLRADMEAFGREFLKDPVRAAAEMPQYASVKTSYFTESMTDDANLIRTHGLDLFDHFFVNGETINSYYDKHIAPRFPAGGSADEINVRKMATLYAVRSDPLNHVTFEKPRRLPGQFSFCPPVSVTYDSRLASVSDELREEIRQNGVKADGEMKVMRQIASMHPYDMTPAQREILASRAEEWAAGLADEEEARHIRAMGALAGDLEKAEPMPYPAYKLKIPPVFSEGVIAALKKTRDQEAVIMSAISAYAKEHGGTETFKYFSAFNADHRDFHRMMQIPADADTPEKLTAFAKSWLDDFLDVPDGRKRCLDAYYDRIDRLDHKSFDLSCLMTDAPEQTPGPDGLTASEHDLLEYIYLNRNAQSRTTEADLNPEYTRGRYKSELAYVLFDAGANRDMNANGDYVVYALNANGFAGAALTETDPSFAEALDKGLEGFTNGSKAHEIQRAMLLGKDIQSAATGKLFVRGRDFSTAALETETILQHADEGEEMTPDMIRVMKDLYRVNVKNTCLLESPANRTMKEAGMNDIDMLYVDGKSIREFVGDKYSGLSADKKDEAMRAEFMAAAMSGKHRTEVAQLFVGKDDAYQVGVTEYRPDMHSLDETEKNTQHSWFRRLFDFGATKIDTRADRQEKLWRDDPDSRKRKEQIKADMGNRVIHAVIEAEKAANAAKAASKAGTAKQSVADHDAPAKSDPSAAAEEKKRVKDGAVDAAESPIRKRRMSLDEFVGEGKPEKSVRRRAYSTSQIGTSKKASGKEDDKSVIGQGN